MRLAPRFLAATMLTLERPNGLAYADCLPCSLAMGLSSSFPVGDVEVVGN
jgi:hypothetical protein